MSDQAELTRLRAEIQIMEAALEKIENPLHTNREWLQNVASEALNDVHDLRNFPTEGGHHGTQN